VGSKVSESLLEFKADIGERRHFDEKFVMLKEVGELVHADAVHGQMLI
jgi:hypothetical protein